jgi:transposase
VADEVKRKGTPTTWYANDPLRGSGRAHAIAKMHRGGASERKIAKRFNVSLDEVRDVLRKLG